MQNATPRLSATPGRRAHRRAGPRRAQRRDLPRPARPGRRRNRRACAPTGSSEEGRDVVIGSAWTSAAPSPTCCWSTTTPARPGGPRPPRRRATSRSGVLHGIEKVCADAGIARRRHRPGAARHHRRHQRDPGGQGRHGRPGDHRRLPAGAADRPLVRARRAGRLDHLAQARAAGRAGEHGRGARADRQRRHGGHRARRGGHPGGAAAAAGQRRRGAGRLADQRLRQRRGTSGASPRSPPRSCPASRCRCPAWCCRRCASTSAR